MQICNGACKAVSAYGGCSMKIEYPSRVKKSTLSRGSVLFLSSGLRPPLTGIRISCSTGATELAAGESGKPGLIILEVRHMMMCMRPTWSEINPDEDWCQCDDNDTFDGALGAGENPCEGCRYWQEEGYSTAAQDDKTFWMI